MRPIKTVEEFYAHALAIEREAAERYAEFAAHFADRGEDVLSGLCANLSSFEQEHYQELVRASEGLSIPVIAAGDYRWLDCDPPEALARELFYRIARPRHLLEIALAAEVRAHAFFVWVAKSSRAEGVRELAAIMAAEETEHIHWVTEALQYHPDSPDRESLLEAGAAPGSAASK